MDEDYYTVLGVGRTASLEQIKESYRRLVRIHHPDANPARREEAEADIKEILEAYRTLSDPGKRELYDLDYRTGKVNSRGREQTKADTHTVYVHPSVTISLLGKVREINGFTYEDMAHRLGLSEDALKQMEARDAIPQTPVQLRTVTHLTDLAIKILQSQGKVTEAENLRNTLHRKKATRTMFK